MKLTSNPIIVALVYIGTQACLELDKEFNTIGSQNLRNYDKYDWAILIVGTLASIGITIKAFLDPTVSKYENGSGKPPVIPPPKAPNDTQTPVPPVTPAP
jgi:hypothetical protein